MTMVCPCCDPFRNCCSGNRRTPDSVLLTITGVTYQEGGVTLSFPLEGEYVLDRVGSQCFQYEGNFYTQTASCFYCPGISAPEEPDGYAGLFIRVSGNASESGAFVSITDPGADFGGGLSGCYFGVNQSSPLDAPICDWLDSSVSGAMTFSPRPFVCTKIASIQYTVEAA